MTQKEKNDLLEELEFLDQILNFHVQFEGKLGMNEKETENYINDILDRILEIKQQLREEED